MFKVKEKSSHYKVLLIAGFSLIQSSPVFAQDNSVQFSDILLSIAIGLGILASIYVFTLSRRMSGSAIAAALILFGVGMLSVVVSLLSVTWLKVIMADYAGFAHDGFFIIGFILMVFGARKVAGVL